MRKYKIGLMPFAALCAALCESVVAGPFSVSLPVAPKLWERTAAKELETWLVQAAKGGDVSVDGCDGVVFHVGDTELAKAKGLAGLEDERWVIRSFGGNVVLNGGGSHGAIYAVSHFLEDFIGVSSIS